MTFTTLSNEEAINTTGSGDTSSAGKQTADSSTNWKFLVIALSTVFCTGLLLCWRTNFSHAALDVAPMFDSGKYISSTEMVMNATTFIHHFTQQEWVTICKALKEPLMMDGPILPLLGAAWFSLIHKNPDLFDMRAALTLQAILHAASACCMFVAARRILRNDKWALFAGLIWAAFPSAVLGAGRFMTENISSTLLLLTVCVVPTKLSSRCLRSVALGVIAAVVGLLKAALLPGIVLGFLVVAICLWKDSDNKSSVTARRLILHAVSIALGAAIILTPWLMFTKEATGSYSITAQREPVLNIVIGGNSETDGWSGNPETDFVKLFDTVNGDKASTFIGIWKSNFPRLENIAVRRIVRLWSCPWNDCLSKFMGLSLSAQWVWHQLILSLAIFGALAMTFKMSKEKLIRPITYLIGALLTSHLVYMVFNASPRQAFTSMPFFALLATCALYELVQAARRNDSAKRYAPAAYLAGFFLLWLVAVCCDFHCILQTVQLEAFAYVASWLIYVCAAAASSAALISIVGNKKLFLPSLCIQVLPASLICGALAVTPRIVPEWQCRLGTNETANRSVFIKSDLKPTWAMLVVDGDFAITRASVEINHTKLSEHLAPLSTFSSDKNLMVNYSVFGGVSNKSAELMRQWRAVEVPLSLLHPGENTISIAAPSGDATIYGSFMRTEDGKLVAPTLRGFSGCKLLSETQPMLEPRYSEPLTATAAQGKCWLTRNNTTHSSDLSSSSGEQSGQYRTFLCLGFDSKQHDTSSTPSPENQVLEAVPTVISAEKPFIKRYAVPKNLGNSTFVNVSIDGEFLEDNVNVLSRVDVRNLTNLGSDLNLPNSIKLINNREFNLSGSLTRSSLDQPNEFFEVKFQSKTPVHLSKLSLKLSADKRPDFARAAVAIY